MEGMLMNKNKIILGYCPNFYKIKNFEYDNEDYITDKLINVYEDYIFSINETDSNSIKKIKELDSILGKYISDYNFRKSIKSGVMNIRVKRGTNIMECIVESLFDISSNYEDGYTRNIYFARWI